MYPESKDRSSLKYVASSASVQFYNVQAKGTQHKSMVNPALKAEGCTSWSIHSIACSKGYFREIYGLENVVWGALIQRLLNYNTFVNLLSTAATHLVHVVHKYTVIHYVIMIIFIQCNMVTIYRCPFSTADVTNLLYLGFPFILDLL